jgi:hypothetical protein
MIPCSMRALFKTRLPLAFALLALACSGIPIRACSVPVFRYALEKWPADPYQALVFHRGPLTEAQKALVRDLGPDGAAGVMHANSAPRLVDLDQNPAPELLDIWRQAGGTTLPWLVVRYPLSVRVPANAWSAPLQPASITQLLDSPVRKEIAERLREGESAVWVMLEVGNREKDDATAKLLETRLAYLGSVLKLPKLDAADIASGLVTLPEEALKLDFSLVRLPRNDPAEQAFVSMLLGTEADLREIGQPIVFPVFGRGRALYALIGQGINPQTIDEAATFLVGKCSCQVKELNPGVDLLLASDWDAGLKAQRIAAADLPKLSELANERPETVVISGTPAAQPAPVRRSTVVYGTIAGFIFAGLLAAGAVWWRRG